jgi:hypothetical protein
MPSRGIAVAIVPPDGHGNEVEIRNGKNVHESVATKNRRHTGRKQRGQWTVIVVLHTVPKMVPNFCRRVIADFAGEGRGSCPIVHVVPVIHDSFRADAPDHEEIGRQEEHDEREIGSETGSGNGRAVDRVGSLRAESTNLDGESEQTGEARGQDSDFANRQHDLKERPYVRLMYPEVVDKLSGPPRRREGPQCDRNTNEPAAIR